MLRMASPFGEGFRTLVFYLPVCAKGGLFSATTCGGADAFGRATCGWGRRLRQSGKDGVPPVCGLGRKNMEGLLACPRCENPDPSASSGRLWGTQILVWGHGPPARKILHFDAAATSRRLSSREGDLASFQNPFWRNGRLPGLIVDHCRFAFPSRRIWSKGFSLRLEARGRR
jgi:hypothetical protein